MGGKPVFRDSLHLSSDEGELADRMAPFEAFASIVFVGARFHSPADWLSQRVTETALQRPNQGPLVVASARPWGHVIRIAALNAESLARETDALLRTDVASLLGDDPRARKW
jgi:hypothetical protein